MLVGATTSFWLWLQWRAQRLASDRLADMIGGPAVTERADEVRIKAVRTFPPRFRFLAPVVGGLVAGLLWLGAGFALEVAAAVGALTGVMAHLLEEYIADGQQAKIEMQLAAAIDLLIGSLRAGSSLLAAFESALQEADRPLRPYLQEVAGRIRLGDDPRVAVNDLQVRVPLETFRLFATSLVIHWEVGGSLATTLSTVGRTVRDRIELSRRVRAQGVESHASVAVVLGMSYLLGFLMWRTNPDRLEGFLATGIGTAIVALVIGLQAVGLVWMSRLSRSRF
jgi:tight adherence protein B